MAVANFLAYRIIIGKLAFKNVPETLKAKVREVLIESGCEEMAV